MKTGNRKNRAWLWFIGLYVAGVLTLGLVVAGLQVVFDWLAAAS